jgi:hypothetical protein
MEMKHTLRCTVAIVAPAMASPALRAQEAIAQIYIHDTPGISPTKSLDVPASSAGYSDKSEIERVMNNFHEAAVSHDGLVRSANKHAGSRLRRACSDPFLSSSRDIASILHVSFETSRSYSWH